MAAAAPIGDAELAGLFRHLEGARIAVAVSGGLDSIVLLHLIGRWRASGVPSSGLAATECPREQAPAGARDLGLPRARPRFSASPAWSGDPGIVVFTVDHRLRSRSAAEAAFVAGEAARLAMPHQTLVWQHGTVAAEMSGLQAKARAARYGLMADLIDAEVWDQWASGMPGRHPLASAETRRVLVTAHHRDDAIETFLMRLKRGSGLEGLASIREVDTLRRPPSEMRPFPSAVRLCRPMLAIGKDRLIATANALGLAWQEDPSNSDARFERVRIRQQTTVLDELGLASEALQLSINRLGGARSLIDRACAVALGDAGGASAAVDWHGGLYATIDPNRLGLLQGPALPSEDAGARLMERVLRHVLARIGGAEEGPELAQLEALARQLGQGTAGMPGETIAGCRIDRPEDLEGRQPGIVRVWREAGRDGLPEISLGPGDGGWWDNRFAVSISAAAPGPVGIRALGIDGVRQLKTQLPEIGRWRGLPDGALATLPAAWSGDGLLAVPSLPAAIAALDSPLRTSIAAGLGDLASGGGFGIRAEFRPWSMA